MRPAGLAVARARAQSGLLLTLSALIAAAAFALIGMDAWHRSAEQTALDQALRAGPSSSAALTLRVATSEEGDLGERLRALPLDVVRTTQSSLPGRHADIVTSMIVRADEGLAGRSELVSGRWPAPVGDAPTPQIHGALQARAAEALGIGVGDHLTVGAGDDTVEVVIDGTWRADDPAATAWAGEPAVGSGRGADGAGPLVVSEHELERLPGQAVTTYVLTPRSSADLPALSRALDELTTSLADTGAVGVTGDLPRRLADVETTRAAGRGLLTVAYILVALTAFVACQQVMALLIDARRAETTLLRSRGAGIATLIGSAAAEAAVVAAAGTTLGAALGTAVFGALDHGPSVRTVMVVAGACIVGTVALASIVTWPSAHASAGRDRRGTGRGVRTVVVALSLAAAALSIGQFLAYDGPLTTTASGGSRVDPITSLAPAAALLALALLGIAVAAPPIRWLERLAARRPGLAPALPVRQLARRLSTFGVAVVLVSLATGFVVMTAALAGTQASLDDRAARMRSGADVRLDLTVDHDAGSGAEAATQPLIDLGDRAAAVMAVPGRVDQEVLSFLATPTDPDITPSAPGLSAITRLLHTEAPGVPLTSSRLDVQLTVTGTITEGQVSGNLWLVDDVGQVAVLPIDPVPVEALDDLGARHIDVPANPHTWRLVAVEAEAPGVSGYATVKVGGLPGVDGYDIDLTSGQSRGQVAVGAPVDELPVAITPALADLIDVRRGDTFDLLLPDSGFHAPVTVAGIVPRIPGMVGARGVAADLPTFVAYAAALGEDLPSPDSVWVTAHDADRVVQEALASSFAPLTAMTSAPPAATRIAGSSVGILWWAAGAVIVFSALAVSAMTTNLARARRGERQILRALGLAPRWQSRIAVRELAGAIGTGAVLGLLTGAVTAALTVPGLSRSAAPGLPATVDPRLSLVVPGLLGLAALLAGGLLIATLRYARRVRHDAGATAHPQVTR